MKKLLSLALALTLCLGLTVVVFASSGEFVIENGVLTKYVGPGGDVIIPDGVRHIADSAFSGCKSMTSVTIPSGVRLINRYAFSGCTGLTSLTIPGGVEIGSESFKGCTSLTSLTLCDGVGFIHAGAFYGCSGLTSVTIPDSVPTLDGDAFRDCTSLTDVVIPASLTDLRGNPFTNTPWFQNQFNIQGEFVVVNGVLLGYNGAAPDLVFPDGITAIGSSWDYTAGYTSFGDDPAHDIILTSVSIPNSVKIIRSGAFWWCNGLKNITIPDSVTTIESRAFAECTGLTSVTIPNSVTTLGAAAFENCVNLISVTVPSSVTTIENNPFIGCSKMTIHGEAGSYIETFARTNNIPFVADGSAASGQSSAPASPTKFTDVATSSPFVDAINWAVEQNITTGKTNTTFAPGEECTNGQILTFLWRANGSPEPTISNPFTDSIPASFQKAAIWAYEKGLVSGGTFGSSTPCTRAMTVEYLWKAAGSPAASKPASFTDVSGNADYAQAVAWAVGQNITSGTGNGSTFSPNNTCTRGQIVTFLYRAMEK